LPFLIDVVILQQLLSSFFCCLGSGDLQVIILREEVKDLQLALKHAQERNAVLHQALKKRNLRRFVAKKQTCYV